MPITNRSRYGFRFAGAINGGQPPPSRLMHIATGYANRIRIGDPVIRVADGSIEIAAEGDVNTYGIVIGGGYYWDGSNHIPAKFVPGGTAWGTVWNRRSLLMVMPAKGCYWEIDVDDQVNTTHATYAALMGGNVDHNIANTGDNDATPTIDVSTIKATAEQWRVEFAPAPTLENEDLAGANVKIWVSINETGQAPAVVAAGI